jgi:hypothetical protein
MEVPFLGLTLIVKPESLTLIVKLESLTQTPKEVPEFEVWVPYDQPYRRTSAKFFCEFGAPISHRLQSQQPLLSSLSSLLQFSGPALYIYKNGLLAWDEPSIL